MFVISRINHVRGRTRNTQLRVNVDASKVYDGTWLTVNSDPGKPDSVYVQALLDDDAAESLAKALLANVAARRRQASHEAAYFDSLSDPK